MFSAAFRRILKSASTVSDSSSAPTKGGRRLIREYIYTFHRLRHALEVPYACADRNAYGFFFFFFLFHPFSKRVFICNIPFRLSTISCILKVVMDGPAFCYSPWIIL